MFTDAKASVLPPSALRKASGTVRDLITVEPQASTSPTPKVVPSAGGSRLAFIYDARGGVWPGVVQSLMADGGQAGEALARCDTFIRARLGWSLHEMSNSNQYAPEHALEPTLTAVQIALTDGWRERGVVPDVVGARCGGEFAAAYGRGALSLEDALEVSCRFSLKVRECRTNDRVLLVGIQSDASAIGSVQGSTRIALTLVADAPNWPMIVACPEKDFPTLRAYLARHNIPYRLFDNPIGYHSSAIEQWRDALSAPLCGLRAESPRVPAYSSSLGGIIDGEDETADYYWRVVREPTIIAPVLQRMIADGCNIFLEIGGHPTLSEMIQGSAGAAGKTVACIASMRRNTSFADLKNDGLRTLADAGYVRRYPATPRETDSVSRDDAEHPRSGADAPADVIAALFDASMCQDPYPVYESLRRIDPLYFDDKRNLWVISSYSAVRRALQDPAITTYKSHLGRTLFGADGEPHARVRQILARELTSAKHAQLKKFIDATAEALIAAAARNGRSEVVAAVGIPLPRAVGMQLLGLEQDIGLDTVSGYAHAATETFNSLLTPSERERHLKVFAEFKAFVSDHLGRPPPPTELALHCLFDGAAGLTLEERVDVGMLLLVAATETTASLTASAIGIVARNPDLFRMLRGDASLVPPFVEEVLRYEPPAQRITRTVARDTSICGRTLRAGSEMLLLLAAANRDPDQFEDPQLFKPFRQPNDHLSFGWGPHRCIGLRVARLETISVLNAVLRNFDSLSLSGNTADAIEYRKNFFLRSPLRLDIVCRRNEYF